MIMRWTVVVVALAACGRSDEGALLVLDAPEGATAQRIEIILASPTAVVDVAEQRVQPSSLAQEAVRYYRQRAITGELTDVGVLDGFAVRLEPNLDVAEDALIPILIAYDEQDQITAIGAVLDQGMPAPVAIGEDELLRFDVAMTPLVVTDGENGLATGEVLTVDCASERSGIAWKPSATQLRLLLPDRSQDPDATDASTRTSDLDCDGHEAVADDCDDLRSAFHAGAVEACDGLDHDCDARSQELVSCMPTGTTPCGETTGVGICADGADAITVACTAEPECACADGTCAACTIHFAGRDPLVSPCTPAIAQLVRLDDCALGCSVEVLNRLGDPFRVLLALPGTNNFAEKLTGVTESIAIEVQGVGEVVGAADQIVGGIFLAVTPIDAASPTTLQSFAIKLAQAPTTCVSMSVMTCSP